MLREIQRGKNRRAVVAGGEGEKRRKRRGAQKSRSQPGAKNGYPGSACNDECRAISPTGRFLFLQLFMSDHERVQNFIFGPDFGFGSGFGSVLNSPKKRVFIMHRDWLMYFLPLIRGMEFAFGPPWGGEYGSESIGACLHAIQYAYWQSSWIIIGVASEYKAR
jgi:hypothetical protein